MEYWQKQQMEANARLRAALDKPLAESREMQSCANFDPWHDLLDGCVSAYNSELDDLAIDVLKAIRDRSTFNLLNTGRALAAELFMHMLSDWLCDYGGSPRGLFPATPEIGDMWGDLIAKWEAYRNMQWTD